MGTVLIKYNILPKGIPKNFQELEKKLRIIVEKFNGKVNQIEEQPIAFGLKAIVLSIALDESKETAQLEEKIKSLHEVSSLDVIDYRRAIE